MAVVVVVVIIISIIALVVLTLQLCCLNWESVKYGILAVLRLLFVIIEDQSLEESSSKIVAEVNNTNCSSEILQHSFWVAAVSLFLPI